MKRDSDPVEIIKSPLLPFNKKPIPTKELKNQGILMKQLEEGTKMKGLFNAILSWDSKESRAKMRQGLFTRIK